MIKPCPTYLPMRCVFPPTNKPGFDPVGFTNWLPVSYLQYVCPAYG